MSTNKPPMTLYFRENLSNVHMDGSHMDNRFGQAFANRKRKADVGPYVHLQQFKSDLIKRAEQLAIAAAEAAECDLAYPLDDCVNYWLLDAYDELAKEIIEGKA